MTPTQRTLAALRKLGHQVAIVERWNQYAKIRQDLFGFIDIVCLTPTAIIGIQCTSGTNVAARVKKICNECNPVARAWLQAGGQIEVWGWRKLKVKRGGKLARWEARVEHVTEIPAVPS